MRIGERLIRDAIITPEQLDAGLRAQVLNGGRLGTNLIELGHIHIDALAECLGRHHGMPAVQGRHFELASTEVQARLPRETAARWAAVPMGRLLGSDDQIAVAVMDPLPDEAIAAISEALGSQIVLAIAPELRVLYQLERAYGIPRSNRFIRANALPAITAPTDDDAQCDIQIHIDGESATEGARSAQPADSTSAPDERTRGAHQPAAAGASRDTTSQLARIAIKRVATASRAGERVLLDAPTNFDDTLRAIRQATGRDRIGDLVVHALRHFFDDLFEAAAILVIRESIAIGWKGFVRGGNDGVVEAVALPLDAPSVVARVFQVREPYIGPPPDGGADIDRRVWALLRSVPATVAVVPIVLDGQTVCLLYGQSTRVPGETAAMTDRLAALAHSTTRAFTRLIRAAQR